MDKQDSAKIKVDTLIISDIHLGSPACRASRLIVLLEQYNCQRLIINGDMFDDLDFKRLSSEHWAVLSYVRKLSKFHEVVWIVGNHDGPAQTLSHLLGVPVFKKYYWNYEGKKCLAMHGDQWDRFLSRNIFISWLMATFYIIIQRLDTKHGAVSNWIRGRKQWLRLSGQVADGAINYAKFRKVDYVFCGHTHQAMQKDRDGVRYINSGSWAEVPSHYVVLAGGKIELKHVL